MSLIGDISYSKSGSQWKKWNLHLHSKASYDYKNKNVTNEEFILHLKNNNISAAVITNHHHIDVENIEKLSKLEDNNGTLILPGIEFCLDWGGSEPIHFIRIFDNKNIQYVWDEIKGNLELNKIN